MPASRRPFRCGHAGPEQTPVGGRDRCPTCGSFWDVDALPATVQYGTGYANERGHLDSVVGQLKVRTLEHWLNALHLLSTPRVVCDVGFGGGWTLSALQQRGWPVHGIEADDSLLAQAASLGIPKANLHLFQPRPAPLTPAVDLWLFQDSFEHLEDPEPFVEWMKTSSATGDVLLVAPEAGSLSDRLLGRAWPHRVEDHVFHWSKAGLVDWWARHEWRLEQSFDPAKCLSLQALLAHLAHHQHWPWLTRWSRHSRMPLPFRFNVGEMGLYFKRMAR